MLIHVCTEERVLILFILFFYGTCTEINSKPLFRLIYQKNKICKRFARTV